MKTNREMLESLKGSLDDKKLLFDELIEKANSEDGLGAGEIVILEALKKELFKIEPEKKILTLEANIVAVGGVKL